MGTVWRRISGSTLGEGGADAAPDTEAGAESFSARRPTEVFDSGPVCKQLERKIFCEFFLLIQSTK